MSWTDTHKKARTGDIKLKVYDEEGFSALKKAQRNNEDQGKVKEIQTLNVYHKGAYQGVVVQSEFLATIVFGLIFYYAHSTKSRILA